MFLIGFSINFQSDSILRNLRKPGETGYKIPRGGFFRFISAPNYFGEMVEWTGWAIATWSMGGAVFAIWTFANLFPRALSNHRWYRESFGDQYPKERRAVIPFLV
jgi:protein-S-isoprenylcysteine O-methyltransferase Ste14